MKQVLYTFLFTTFAAAGTAQNIDSLIAISHPNAMDTLKAEILTKASEALRTGRFDKYALYYALFDDFEKANFEWHLYEVFPLTLDLHIQRNSWLKAAAIEIKQELSTKRM